MFGIGLCGPNERHLRRILREELKPLHDMMEILMTGQSDFQDMMTELTAEVSTVADEFTKIINLLTAGHVNNDDALFESAAQQGRDLVTKLQASVTAADAAATGTDTTTPPSGDDTLSGGQGNDSVSGTDTTAGV